MHNVASVLQAADTYQVTHLRQHCINFIVENFVEVVRTEAFRELVSVESRPLMLTVLEDVAGRMQQQSAAQGAPSRAG